MDVTGVYPVNRTLSSYPSFSQTRYDELQSLLQGGAQSTYSASASGGWLLEKYQPHHPAHFWSVSKSPYHTQTRSPPTAVVLTCNMGKEYSIANIIIAALDTL